MPTPATRAKAELLEIGDDPGEQFGTHDLLRDTIQSLASVGTMAELRALPSPTTVGDITIRVEGYTTFADHAGVRYKWDAANGAADNSGTKIKPTATSGLGRWRMLATSGEFDVRWFGAVGDYEGIPGSGTDDTVAFQRAIDQIGTGGILRIPGSTVEQGSFRMRITDEVNQNTFAVHIRGTAGGSSAPQIQADFSDSAKALLKLSKRTKLSDLVMSLGGTTTTGIAQVAAASLCLLSDLRITGCNGHGILGGTSGGLMLHRCTALSSVSTADTQATADGTIGIQIGTDGMAHQCYVDGGFNYGIVGRGVGWQIVGGIYDQSRVGILALEGSGTIIGGRLGFNWVAGLMCGLGHITTFGGGSVSVGMRQLQVTGLITYQTGEDRTAGTDHNKSSYDYIINAKEGPNNVFVSNADGGNLIDNDSFDITARGILLAGGSIAHVNFVGGKMGGYVDGETIQQAVTSTEWAATTAFSLGDVIFQDVSGDDHCYVVTSAGTTASTAPTHTDFDIVTDGTADLAHIGLRLEDANSIFRMDNMMIEEGDSLVQIGHEGKRIYGGVEVRSGLIDVTDSGVLTKTDDYTLVRNDTVDGGKTVVMNKGTANTLTVQPFVTVAALVGEQFSVFCKGAGTCTVTPGSAVTITGTATVAQNASAVFRCIALNEWARISA